MTYRRIRLACIITGAVFILLVLFAPLLKLSQPGIGTGKLIILLLAGVLILIGIFGSGFPKFYNTLAVLLLNTIVLLVIIELGLSIVNRVWRNDAINQQTSTQNRLADNGFPYDPRSDLSVYQNVEWGEQYWEDYATAQFSEYTPYTLWRRKAITTDTINIRGDVRLTQPNECTEDSVNIFMFGGSTMWGSGAPDWATIASYLQPLLSEQREQPICIFNFGQPGWITNQNLIHLTKELMAGNVPDIVIFYDGYNDTRLAFSLGVAGTHYQYEDFAQLFAKANSTARDTSDPIQNILKNTQTYQFLSNFITNKQTVVEDFEVEEDFEPYLSEDMTQLANDVIENYLNVYRMTQALSQSYDFEAYFFWQPQVTTTQKILSAEESERIDAAVLNYQPQLFEFITRVDEQISERFDAFPNIYDISDVFDDLGEDEFIWLDLVHVTHIGNQFIAEHIATELSSAVGD